MVVPAVLVLIRQIIQLLQHSLVVVAVPAAIVVMVELEVTHQMVLVPLDLVAEEEVAVPGLIMVLGLEQLAVGVSAEME
jgi:hypothetical protein